MITRKILITGGSGFIGTNLTKEISELDAKILNIDTAKPKINFHNSVWCECDILDKKKLDTVVNEFMPEYVIHLAARPDIKGERLSDYDVNFDGTSNLLDALKSSPVKRAIFTSSQYVNQYGGVITSDDDYAPHTVYGESKILMEKIIKSSDLHYAWIIIRPTNVWGPWHTRYPFEFWKVLSEHKYFHPSSKTKVIRNYGYVGNVVWQIINLLEINVELINRKTFYVGDLPIDIFEWVNGFSNTLIGKNVRVVPQNFIRILALFGDMLNKFGKEFPITTTRFKNMITGNAAPMEPIFQLLGNPPFSLYDGIIETVKWMKVYHPKLVKVNE
jgi:nucleoside-diphosphate-sugar epimerase